MGLGVHDGVPGFGVLDATPDRLVRFGGGPRHSPDYLARHIVGPDTGDAVRVAGDRVVVEERMLEMPTGLAMEAHPVAGLPPTEGEIGDDAGDRPGLERQADDDGEPWQITIYCCKNDPGGAYCGLTASGVPVAPGMAACSSHWPFGTRFLVAGRYPVTCLDRGSAVTQPNHLDIHFDDCGNQEDPAPGTGWWWKAKVGDWAIVEVVR